MAQVINGRLVTPQGAPRGLTFELPSSMINSTKTEQRNAPYGQAVYTTAGQVPKFIIPRTDRAFANTETMYITGNVDMTGAFTGAVAGTDLMYILGTYYSLFSRWVVSSNGKQLETIERPGELVNLILNQTLNPSEKRGMANNLGYYNDIAGLVAGELDATYNICQAINTGAASNILIGGNGKSFTFALPVIGLLQASKYLPLFNGDFTLELTINAMINWLVGKTILANTAINATVGFSISNLELVYDQITLTPESFGMVMQNYPEKLYIKSQSYDFGSGAQFTVTPSVIDIPVNIKRSSLKQVLLYFAQADAIDKTFGGVNCNINDIVFITNGQQWPQRPIRVNINPSEVFNQVQKAWGSLYSGSHSGCMGKMEFCRRTTGSNNYYAALVTGATDADYGQIISASNKFYMAIDTETVNYSSDSLYSGVPMGVNSNFRVQIGDAATAKLCTPMFWMCYDAIIEFDLVSGINNVIA